MRNHFSGDNPQTTFPSDFSAERSTKRFRIFHARINCFSWIKMCIVAFLHSKPRWNCALSWLFVSLWRSSFLTNKFLWPCLTALRSSLPLFFWTKVSLNLQPLWFMFNCFNQFQCTACFIVLWSFIYLMSCQGNQSFRVWRLLHFQQHVLQK